MTMDVKTSTRQSGPELGPKMPGFNAGNITRIQQRIETKNRQLLKQPYFQLCRTKEITRSQVIDVIKQVYCFSFFFERLLSRRIADSAEGGDARVLAIARHHLREELGHVSLFQECLSENGVSDRELAQLKPTTFTRAVFGYLLATIQHENEYVSNVGMMQVMETIGSHFFSATLDAMQAHGMAPTGVFQHAQDDEWHATLGLELLGYVDDRTLCDSERVIDDLYRLMGLMFEEWLGRSVNPRRSVPPPRKHRSVSPRANWAQVSPRHADSGTGEGFVV